MNKTLYYGNFNATVLILNNLFFKKTKWTKTFDIEYVYEFDELHVKKYLFASNLSNEQMTAYFLANLPTYVLKLC